MLFLGSPFLSHEIDCNRTAGGIVMLCVRLLVGRADGRDVCTFEESVRLMMCFRENDAFVLMQKPHTIPSVGVEEGLSSCVLFRAI